MKQEAQLWLAPLYQSGPPANAAVSDAPLVEQRGRVTEVTGTIIKAIVPGVQVGELCLLRSCEGDFELQAEVVGFAMSKTKSSSPKDMLPVAVQCVKGNDKVTHIHPVARSCGRLGTQSWPG